MSCRSYSRTENQAGESLFSIESRCYLCLSLNASGLLKLLVVLHLYEYVSNTKVEEHDKLVVG
jgi:hypothetical protein